VVARRESFLTINIIIKIPKPRKPMNRYKASAASLEVRLAVEILFCGDRDRAVVAWGDG
jgi:hypothetical protein